MFTRQFSSFFVVGAAGFVTDGSILTTLSVWLGWNVYFSRVVSFFFATLVTWLLNRTITFDVSSAKQCRKKEYAGYFLIQSIGAMINLGVFYCTLLIFPQLIGIPVIPLAVGSVVAMLFNYTMIKRLLYAD